MGPRHTPEQASSSKTNPLRLSTLGRNFLGDQIAKSHDESEVSLEYNEKFLSSSSDISPQSLLTLGRQCAQLFFQLCNRPESKVKGLEELQNNLDRFKIWAGNIGLFAPGLAGIDYRFAQDDDGRDVLESMLSKLKVRPGKSAPQALLSTLDSSVRRLEAKSFDLLVASSSEESSIAEESTSGESNHAAADESDPATRGIDEIITQLYRFLVFVKKPTSNREYAEVIAFKNRQLEAGNHEDIESYVRWYIARHLPLASPTIAERLATAAIYRNWKILYKNKHAEKLKHDSESWFIPRNPQSVLEQPMLPHIVKAPQILQQMPTIIEPTEDDTKKRVNFVPMSVTEASTIRKLLVPAAPKSSFSAITHSAVIRRGKLDVPSAPEMEEMAKETVCPYCCQVVGPELLGKGSTTRARWV
ncbi:hypothetical protein EJ08DRAFT_578710 [Tothia fuscella]|uniref:Uncharacterized protein n=1 Tax=Tothia fuscella TaxID=1048955 RepID=A0A9P4U562_9PEZI|nr:hypothetical protein EJ08DRAFT_578710 [Tothia fuscella]